MFIMQNAAIEMHWLMVNHVSRLKKAEKPKMLVWRTEFGRGVFFWGKLNKPCGYWFCQKWLLIISKRPKKSSEWCYFNLTPPTDHGTILRRSPHSIHTPRLNDKTDSGKIHLQDLARWWRTSKGVDIPKISQFYWGLFEKTRFLCFYIIKSSKKRAKIEPKYP